MAEKIVNCNGIIIGGGGNTIGTTAGFSGIAAGVSNTISNGADHSFIGGGVGNTASGQYNSILGGSGNTLTGNYSAILGGSGNSDGGFSYAGVFGQGITAVANNTFHVECLNAVNTPTGPGPFPSGTISYTPTATLPAGALGFLVIW